MSLRYCFAILAGALFMTAEAEATDRVLLAPSGASSIVRDSNSAAAQQGPSPALTKETEPGTLARLRAAAAKDGKVRVIVGYRVPFAPEGELGTAERARQRQEIATAGQNLFRKFSASAQDGQEFQALSGIPFAVLTVTQNQLGALANDPNVLSIAEDKPMMPQLTYSVPLIGAPDAWKAGATGKGQVVAIVDFGFQTNHPFLRDPASGMPKVVFEGRVEWLCTTPPNSSKEVCGQTVTAGPGMATLGDESHGTSVAGIIVGQRPASSTNEELTGVAPDARLMVIRAVYTSEIIYALGRIYELREQYKIAAVNLSLGDEVRVYNGGNCDGISLSFRAALGNLRAAGIAPVAAAGNNSKRVLGGYTGATDRLMTPACISTAVSVGAVYSSNKTGNKLARTERFASTLKCGSFSQPVEVDQVACFSNTAPELTLLAPGYLIETSGLYGGYDVFFSGTSAAAPHVAGAFAVLRSAMPTATIDQMLNALRVTGKPVRDYRTGMITPRIEIAAALAYLQSGGQPAIAYKRIGDGNGTVNFSPAVGLAPCRESCTNIVATGTTVTMTAQPDSGTWFLGWNSADGECEGTMPTCTFQVNKQVTFISASFGQKKTTPTYTLRYSRVSAGNGSGTLTAQANGAAIACNDAVCTTTQPVGTSMTLTAQPDTRSNFVGWSGACTGSAPSCSFRLTANTSVDATFHPQTVSLTILKMGPGNLSVDLNGKAVPCAGGTGCSVTGPVGAMVNVTAAPDSGSIFSGWSGVCKGADAKCSVPLTVKGGVAVATFAVQPGKQASAQ